MKNKKKQIIILVVSIIIICLSFYFSYAFLVDDASGNPTTSVVSLGSNKLQVTDSVEIDQSMSAGQSLTKYISVKNIGDSTASYSLAWLYVKNTYTYGNLTYQVKCTEYNVYNEPGSSNVVSDNSMCDGYYGKNLLVPYDGKNLSINNGTIAPGKTHLYKIDFSIDSNISIENINDYVFTGKIGVIDRKTKYVDELGILGVLKTKYSGIIKSTPTTIPARANSGTTEKNLIEYNVGVYYGGSTYAFSNYYLRGSFNDNYVMFAGYRWRVMRLEDLENCVLILDDVLRYDTQLTNYLNTNYPSYTLNYINDIVLERTTATNRFDVNNSIFDYPSTSQWNTITDYIEYNLTKSKSISTLLNSWYNIKLNKYSSLINNVPYTLSTAKGDDLTFSSNTRVEYTGGSKLLYNVILNRSATLPRNTTSSYKSVKIALPSGDDVALAGSTAETANTDYYLFEYSTEVNTFLTLTPASIYLEEENGNKYGIPKIINVNQGKLEEYTASEYGRLRPVIAIRFDSFVLSGTGTKTDPYIIDLNEN